MNVNGQVNQASIAGTVTAPSIEVRALVGGDGVTTFDANAISGGGGEASSASPAPSP